MEKNEVPNKRNVLIIAGEASADLHGANLVKAMKRLNPETRVKGIGGSKMEAAGVEILIPSSDMAVVGLTEVFSKINIIVKAYFRLRYLLKNSTPDLLILIDYPGFNIALARVAKNFGVPVLYYISPQLWAWRSGRVKKIASRIDKMAVILPFEKDFYIQSGTGIDVEYVGHPLLDAVPRSLNRSGIKNDLGLYNGGPFLGLLPGSRNEEIKNLLPTMVSAAEIISARYPGLKCVLPVAPTISKDLILSFTDRASVDIVVSEKDIYSVLSVCDLALVTSGTATLETALMGVPMIIAYRMSPISYKIARMVVKVSHAGLVNLVAGEEIVPELIQDALSPRALADKALSILDNEDIMREMKDKLGKLKKVLGSYGASDRTATIALEMMKKS